MKFWDRVEPSGTHWWINVLVAVFFLVILESKWDTLVNEYACWTFFLQIGLFIPFLPFTTGIDSTMCSELPRTAPIVQGVNLTIHTCSFCNINPLHRVDLTRCTIPLMRSLRSSNKILIDLNVILQVQAEGLLHLLIDCKSYQMWPWLI